jgi:hypothetical protein
MRKSKIPSTFAFWNLSMQIAWLEQHGYPELADDLRFTEGARPLKACK